MTRGLTREQLGITEQMVLTFGETVFDLSHNVQVRRGDPVRLLDWDQIEAQRPGTGLADVEIAGRIGLTREQVTCIRVIMEHRRFQRRHYHRLYELGGGRRFRADRFTPHEERAGFEAHALALREALEFDPRVTDRYLRDGNWTGDTLPGLLARRAAETPDSPAIIDGDRVTSYAELHGRVGYLAAALLDLDVGRGEVVAMRLSNAADFALASFAAMTIGAVACPLPAEGGLAGPLSPARACVLLCDPETAHTPGELRDGAPDLDHIIVGGTTAPVGTLALEPLLGCGDGHGAENTALASDPALVLFATHDRPPARAVVHSGHTVLAGMRGGAAALGFAPGETLLAALPCAGPIGFWTLSVALVAGGAGAVLPEFTPDALADAAARHRPEHLLLSPDQAAQCIRSNALGEADLTSVRHAWLAAPSCDAGVARDLEALLPNGTVGRSWGCAETLVALATPAGAPAGIRHETLGRAIPGMEARVLADDEANAPPDAPGELQLPGAATAPGYLDDDAAKRRSFTADGWLRTGLKASADQDGHIRPV